jgi:hypothetical protein
MNLERQPGPPVICIVVLACTQAKKLYNIIC